MVGFKRLAELGQVVPDLVSTRGFPGLLDGWDQENTADSDAE